MDTKQTIKEIADYFNLDMSDYDRKRLDGILQKISVKKISQKVIKETVFVKVGDKIKIDEINLNDYAERSCAKYGITHAMFFSRNRTTDVVCARIHFVRSVIYACIDYPQLWLAKFLKIDHSTIVHYLYHVKKPCEYPPLKFKIKNERKNVINQVEDFEN